MRIPSYFRPTIQQFEDEIFTETKFLEYLLKNPRKIARQFDEQSDPLYRYLKDTLKTKHITFDKSEIVVGKDGERTKYPFPDWAQEFVYLFDLSERPHYTYAQLAKEFAELLAPDAE